MSPAAGGEPTFVPVGEPLAPAEAAYVQHEIAKRGIEARLRDAETPGPELMVEVRAADRQAGAALCRELLKTTVAPESDQAPQDTGGHRRALLAGATGTVAVLYLGRALPGALRTALAIVVGAMVYVAVSRRTRKL